eukprot:11109032-Alexandrium_andersonii.AAC.1
MPEAILQCLKLLEHETLDIGTCLGTTLLIFEPVLSKSRNPTYRVAGPSDNSYIFCPETSPGGCGPGSPEGPRGPVRGSESAHIGALLFG